MLPRAPRLLIRAPVMFRHSPRTPWREGWTINVSQSGVLIAAESPAEVRGDLEFLITLSKGALQGPGVPLLPDLHCRGQVVRHVIDADGICTIAANIRRQMIRLPGSKGRK
jgi:PilZ domain.